ncbi:MAG: hypothetical protein ACTSYK_07425, partial [Alphaproteobacteria bacterium]
MQLKSPKSDDKDRQHTEWYETPEETAKRVSVRPLLKLRPYLLRHKGMLAAAFVSLVVAAGATLAVPLAVRR